MGKKTDDTGAGHSELCETFTGLSNSATWDSTLSIILLDIVSFLVYSFRAHARSFSQHFLFVCVKTAELFYPAALGAYYEDSDEETSPRRSSAKGKGKMIVQNVRLLFHPLFFVSILCVTSLLHCYHLVRMKN